jgi:hypothetical protein
VSRILRAAKLASPQNAVRRAGKALSVKGIETSLAQRKTEYSSAYGIAELYADLGEKDQAFQWLNTGSPPYSTP